MSHWALWALLMFGHDGGARWVPPKNPDPQKILNEAEEDARAGRHAQALAKHIWFHRNVLQHEQAFYGVRLSFALSDWAALAAQYPPAMTALRKERDTALASFRRGKSGRLPGPDPGHDFVAINRALSEEDRTVEAFKEVEAVDAEKAKEFYRIASPALIKAREYELCGKYIKPASAWAEVLTSYRMSLATGEENPDFGKDFAEFTRKNFVNATTTLIGLLARTDRRDDAVKIADDARRQLDDAEFHAAIDQALEGVVPDPWP